MSDPEPVSAPAAAPVPAAPPPATLHAIQQTVLAWFAAHGRDLPWRHTRDPYMILVAEVMLQQTQVERVRPKYHAFLAAFPTVAALAAADPAQVIRMWAGLGYNRRAVNLQRTARAVCADYGGAFPRSVDELRTLPGIGPYTAGAVACFAFEQDVAFIDTNIRRVVRRVFVGPEAADPPPNERQLLALAQAALPAGQGWPWNQGIMELGATICTAAAPQCWRCPLRAHCRAYQAWRQADETAFDRGDSPGEQPYAALPRRAKRVAERRAAPFVGSNRYYRGRLVAALRDLPPGERRPLAELGPLVRPDFDATHAPDLAWLRELASGLVRDGLAEMDTDMLGLPAMGQRE